MNCSEVRRMFQAGPAVYTKEIATKDVNSLKVTIFDLSKEMKSVVLKHNNTQRIGAKAFKGN